MTDADNRTAVAGQVERPVRPVAWALKTHGRMHKVVIRDDVADEYAAKLRDVDPLADAVPLYDAAALTSAIAAEREKLAALYAEIDRLQAGHERYETARRMNPRQWADAWKLNISTGKPFDEIVDDLRPFLRPNV